MIGKPLERHDAAQCLASFFSRYEGRDLSEVQQANAFIGWARRYHAALDADLAPQALAAKLAKTALMDDQTDISSWVSVD
ncbi:MAG: hypothetical protein JWR80_5820 [Bradyrhizobium sp.]|nr:hypothetical protein [Bradyrhizobium sp.]